MHSKSSFRLIFLICCLLSVWVTAQLDRKWYLNYLDGKDELKKGNYEKAREYLEYAIEQKGKSQADAKFYGNVRGPYIPYFYLGVAYFKLNKLERAQYHFEKSQSFGEVEQMPEKTELAQYMQEIQRRLAQSKPVVTPPQPTLTSTVPPIDSQAEKEFQQALDLFTRERYADAKPLLEKIRRSGGNYAVQAEQMLRRIRASESLEKDVEQLAREADDAYQQGNWVEAFRKYREVGLKQPGYAGLLDKIERCRRAQRLAPKLEQARSLIETNPIQAEGLVQEIQREDPSFPGLDKVAAAVTEAKRRKELSDSRSTREQYLNEGRAAFQEGNLDKARLRLLEAQKLNPSPQQQQEITQYLNQIQQKAKQANEIKDLLAKGKAELQAGRREEARQAYQDVLARDPRNAEAITMLGVLKSTGSGNGEEVYRKLLRAGVRQFLLGDYAEAESSLKNYLAFSTEKAGLARFFLGAALVSHYFVDRYNSKELLDEGVKQFQETRRIPAFQLPEGVRSLISPRVLEVYEKGLTTPPSSVTVSPRL